MMFDSTLERKLESKADGRGGGVTDVRRIELITGAGRRRRWSSEDKARIPHRRANALAYVAKRP